MQHSVADTRYPRAPRATSAVSRNRKRSTLSQQETRHAKGADRPKSEKHQQESGNLKLEVSLCQHFPLSQKQRIGKCSELIALHCERFFDSTFFSWFYSIYGPDFEARRIWTFVSYSQSYLKFFRVRRCSLQRRFCQNINH